MKYNFDFDDNKAEIQLGKDLMSEKLEKLLRNINYNAVFDTGILPIEKSGLVSFRKGFGRTQYVYQMEPQEHLVLWGASESTQNKTKYLVAEPWKIIIADFDNDNFLGLRHFYAMEPIFSPKIPLYAINLPNTNTIGYSGTSVGWTCLYRTTDTSDYSIVEQINYFLERESGANEPYNDANMSSTDGPRFYSKRGAKQFIYNPGEWQKKTKAEGVNWTLDPELWIPLRIKWESDPAATMHHDKGEIYTVGDAMHRPYYAYYPSRATQAETLPINHYKELLDQDKDPWADKDFVSSIPDAWRTGKTVAKTGRAAAAPPSTESLLETLRKSTKVTDSLKNLYLSDGTLCIGCNTKFPANNEFTQVITAYHVKEPAVSVADIVIDDSHPFCENCAAGKSARPHETLGMFGHWRFAVDVLGYSVHTNTFHLKDFMVYCPKCTNGMYKGIAYENIVIDANNLTTESTVALVNGKWTEAELANHAICCSHCSVVLPALKEFVWNNPISTYPSLKFGVNAPEFNEDFYAKFGDDPLDWKVFTQYKTFEIRIGDKNKGPGFERLDCFVPTLLLKALKKTICPCEVISSSSEACNMCLNEKGEYVSQLETLTKVKL